MFGSKLTAPYCTTSATASELLPDKHLLLLHSISVSAEIKDSLFFQMIVGTTSVEQI